MKAGWLSFTFLLIFCGCASTQGDRREHGIGNRLPSARQWRDAAANAARHPGTWAPVIGAAIIAAGSWDGDISDWAVKERPVFGSWEAAQDASDILRSSAHVGMVASALAVPSGDDRWLSSMAWRMAWEHLGVMAASYTTDPIKRWTDRKRPNGGPGSFPSWHATRAAAYTGMGYRNLDLVKLRPAFRRSTQFILASIAAGTAWARVEAGQHYPTDVLAGAALGNFVAILIHDAFISLDKRSEISLQTNTDKSAILELEVRF
jgi:membrane-associated phospholipid phosphatase